MFPTASEQALDLLKHLLVFNPNHRYSAADALNHRYVKDFHDEAEEIVCHDPISTFRLIQRYQWMTTKNFQLDNIVKHYTPISLSVKNSKERNGKLNIFKNQGLLIFHRASFCHKNLRKHNKRRGIKI